MTKVDNHGNLCEGPLWEESVSPDFRVSSSSVNAPQLTRVRSQTASPPVQALTVVWPSERAPPPYTYLDPMHNQLPPSLLTRYNAKSYNAGAGVNCTLSSVVGVTGRDSKPSWFPPFRVSLISGRVLISSGRLFSSATAILTASKNGICPSAYLGTTVLRPNAISATVSVMSQVRPFCSIQVRESKLLLLSARRSRTRGVCVVLNRFIRYPDVLSQFVSE